MATATKLEVERQPGEASWSRLFERHFSLVTRPEFPRLGFRLHWRELVRLNAVERALLQTFPSSKIGKDIETSDAVKECK